MHIELLDEPFQPFQRLADYQPARTDAGATAVFIGTSRDYNLGETVSALHLEHYPGMTERQLQEITAYAEQRWTVLDGLVVHRVGLLKPGEAIVLVAVWAGHRGDAFDACRFIMEELKHKAPFWKKEQLADGRQRWVEQNSTGYAG
ncbi:MAG: molybdenum cofactor biosynthesis protein MoaE [Methylococcales bacterium]|nr:molybdenum cofactor biosynthesis protein MoaE [Methylococcales bacterium]